MTPPSAFLDISGLECRYGTVRAVSDVTLRIARGELVSLLGPSGCGKTTTLQMIAGFVAPTAGTIAIDGEDMRGVPANRRRIGIVFQSYALFPHMTVAQNVAFGLEMRRVPARTRRERVAAALEQVHLAPLADRYPRQLSGGQQQRVALARALVIEPRVLLLDEPMSNLDARLRQDMQFELRRLQRLLGITTLLVTHDQAEAMALSDRIAVMQAGRIVQVDTPRTAYEQPGNDFISAFLGKSNTFAAHSAAGACLLNGAAAAAEGLFCSLRPEKLSFIAPDRGRLRGTVLSRMFLGHHWLFQIATPAGAFLVYRQNDDTAVPEEGSQVGLIWDDTSLRLLPAMPHG